MRDLNTNVHEGGKETHRGDARGEGSLSGGCTDWMREATCLASSMFSTSSDGLSCGEGTILKRVKWG